MKLNGTHQLFVYADDINKWGGSYVLLKTIEALLVGSLEIGLEVDADKTNYMVLSRNQNAGRSHNTQTVNRSCRKVEEFKYSGTNLTN